MSDELNEKISYQLPDSFFDDMRKGLGMINKAITDYSFPNPEKNIVIKFFENKFNLCFDGQFLSMLLKYEPKDCEEKTLK